MLVISANISIPDDELRFTFSRSGGPGGQNVNKVNSKATLHWPAVASLALPPDVRERLLKKFANRLTGEGEFVISSQESRDQPKNIDLCLSKLKEMIVGILVPPKKRRPTKPSKGSHVRRLNAKKNRSDVKKGRSGGRGGDGD